MTNQSARRIVITAAVFNAVIVLTMPMNWFTLVNAFCCGATISAAIGLTYAMHMEQAMLAMAAALRSMGELQENIVQAWAAENERRDPEPDRTVH